MAVFSFLSLLVSHVRPPIRNRLAYDAEAFAILDTLNYIKNPVYTVCVGTAWGEAAMLLAAGEKVRSSSHTHTHTQTQTAEMPAVVPAVLVWVGACY